MKKFLVAQYHNVLNRFQFIFRFSQQWHNYKISKSIHPELATHSRIPPFIYYIQSVNINTHPHHTAHIVMIYLCFVIKFKMMMCFINAFQIIFYLTTVQTHPNGWERIVCVVLGVQFGTGYFGYFNHAKSKHQHGTKIWVFCLRLNWGLLFFKTFSVLDINKRFCKPFWSISHLLNRKGLKSRSFGWKHRKRVLDPDRLTF